MTVSDKWFRRAEKAEAINAELLEALKWSERQIVDLCDTVNRLNVRLGGIPRKVRAEDWTEKTRKAIAKAT